MLNYGEMLETSPRPYHTLAQAFVTYVGTGIDTRLLQRLLKQYDPHEILDGIQSMGGKKLDNPPVYLMAVLRNRRKKNLAEVKAAEKFDSVLRLADEDQEELVLRRPFNGDAT